LANFNRPVFQQSINRLYCGVNISGCYGRIVIDSPVWGRVGNVLLFYVSSSDVALPDTGFHGFLRT
jgi:hypothetical protein